jgi:hypothetical protein
LGGIAGGPLGMAIGAGLGAAKGLISQAINGPSGNVEAAGNDEAAGIGYGGGGGGGDGGNAGGGGPGPSHAAAGSQASGAEGAANARGGTIGGMRPPGLMPPHLGMHFKPPHLADGGMGIPLSQADPWWTRREASSDGGQSAGGFLAGTTGGRQDAVKTTAPAGAYVLPADVVAGLGEGNSLAGAKVWQTILQSGPWGTPEPRGARGMGPPRPPSLGRAAGGAAPAPQHADVALSHGEIVVSPAEVQWFGKGDMKKGWHELDKFVMEQRHKYARKLLRLPGPVGAEKNAKHAKAA